MIEIGKEIPDMELEAYHNNEISKNNIYKNKYRNTWFIISNGNEWFNNYWGRIRIFPKIILGIRLIYLFSIDTGPRGSENKIFLPLPKFNFDRNPAKEPYDIGV